MIIKATLCTLLLILVVVIATSYYVNKEGFDDISNGYLSSISNDLESAMNTVSSDVGSAISTVSSDVGGAISTVSSDIMPDSTAPVPDSDTGSSVPTRTDVVPEVSISGSGYNAMNLNERSELLKDIQKLVKNEVLANRSTKPIISGETRKSQDTDSTAQGREYEESCYKDTEYRCPKNPDGSCPPVPDMTQYIKKDEIPCYGCSLDY
jgi:hypothetical protein